MGENGFKLETVKSCPVVKGSRGVITMAPSLIADIAGAVRDKIEWIVLLNGTRSADGYEINVDQFTVPQQYRGGADAEMLEVELASTVVGVMHSHHKMGAFFSGTDVGQLNPRFPSSIVVAIANNNLGFNYKAVGKVILPCGAVGEEVEFALAVAGVKRFAQEVVRPEHTGGVKDIGDCLHYQSKGEYVADVTAACGLTTVMEVPMAFGMDGRQLLEVIAEQTVVPPTKQISAGSYTGFTGPGKFDRYKNEQGKKKGKKGRRNGLVKLERPEPGLEQCRSFYAKSGVYMWGRCDSCRQDGTKKKHPEFDEFLCVDCWYDTEMILASIEDDTTSQFERIMDGEDEGSLITVG